MPTIVKRVTGLLCGLLIVGAIGAGAMAGDAPDGRWRPPPVGTLLEYNYGESCRVVAVETNRYHCEGDRSFQVQGTSWSVYRGMLRSTYYYDGSPFTFDESKLDRLFPLEVGKKTTLEYAIGDYRVRVAYKVTAFKTIRTRLGPRPVFVVSYVERGPDGYRGKGWSYLDAELGFGHSGKHITVSDGNKESIWRLFNVELPAAGDGN